MENYGSNSFEGDANAKNYWAYSTTDELPGLEDRLIFDQQSIDATCPSEDSYATDEIENLTDRTPNDACVHVDLLVKHAGYKVGVRDTFLHFDEDKPFIPLRRIG